MELKIICGALLLQLIFSGCTAQVSITTPPEDATVCRGSDVTISCGYDSHIPLDPVWKINATFLQQSHIMNMSSYQLNNPKTPVNYSLRIFSINGTTEIRCAITSQSLNITAVLSRVVTVTVIDQPVVKISATTGGCGYVSVSWTASSSSDVCRITQYNVTISSATMNVTISSCRVNSHNFTDLPDDTLFNVTVTGINTMGFVSNPDSTSVRIPMTCIRSDDDGPKESGLDSLSTGIIVAITNAMTFILTLTATAIITLTVRYFCVKRGSVNANPQCKSKQEKMLYKQVNSPSHTSICKDDLELKSNPAYGPSYEVAEDTNAAYESCK